MGGAVLRVTTTRDRIVLAGKLYEAYYSLNLYVSIEHVIMALK